MTIVKAWLRTATADRADASACRTRRTRTRSSTPRSTPSSRSTIAATSSSSTAPPSGLRLRAGGHPRARAGDAHRPSGVPRSTPPRARAVECRRARAGRGRAPRPADRRRGDALGRLGLPRRARDQPRRRSRPAALHRLHPGRQRARGTPRSCLQPPSSGTARSSSSFRSSRTSTPPNSAVSKPSYLSPQIETDPRVHAGRVDLDAGPLRALDPPGRPRARAGREAGRVRSRRARCASSTGCSPPTAARLGRGPLGRRSAARGRAGLPAGVRGRHHRAQAGRGRAAPCGDPLPDARRAAARSRSTSTGWTRRARTSTRARRSRRSLGYTPEEWAGSSTPALRADPASGRPRAGPRRARAHARDGRAAEHRVPPRRPRRPHRLGARRGADHQPTPTEGTRAPGLPPRHHGRAGTRRSSFGTRRSTTR